MREHRLARRLIRQRLLKQALGTIPALSSVFPDADTIAEDATRANLQKDIANYLAAYNGIYEQLLNDVRVNLPNKLRPVLMAMTALTEMSSLDQQTVATQFDQVKQQLTTLQSSFNSGSQAAVNEMRGIVQKCNMIIQSLNS